MWSKAVYNVTTLNNKRDITEPYTYQTKNNQQLTTSVGHIFKQVDHIFFYKYIIMLIVYGRSSIWNLESVLFTRYPEAHDRRSDILFPD